MPKQISVTKIIDATLSAIDESQIEYEKWSGGCWLWEAPEYLITSNVARHISAIDGSKYITLESGASSAIEDAGARGRGKLHRDIRENGRVDILLWWANESPRAVIEIKNQIFSKDQYEKDIKRIKEFLKRNSEDSSFQFGLLGFYQSAADGSRKTSSEKIIDRLEVVKSNTKKILSPKYSVNLFKTKIRKIEDSAWCSACLLIKKST